jgi:riboflavin synthase
MFTGIVECLGHVVEVVPEATNLHYWLTSPITADLKVDQSVAHNGVCLTVVEICDNKYKVTAIAETLAKTNLLSWKVGDAINLERAMLHQGRLDGHMVQGHVDTTAVLSAQEEKEGSTQLYFQYEQSEQEWITVAKGSVCVNGISLTVVHSAPGEFSVCIIPYTWEHTNLKYIKVGEAVNLEFDIFGKYVFRYMKAYEPILANHLKEK